MTPGSIPLKAIAALTLALPLHANAQARERVAYVSVVDAGTGLARTDLSARDIVVREDGVTREVLRVTPATGAMPIAVLVDTSAAAEPAIADLRAALRAFLARLGEVGPVAIVTFGDRPAVVADYSAVAATVEAGINRVFAQPGSGATLIEAVSESAAGLARREGDRAALVVITAGGPELSTLHYTRALDRLRASGASLHLVALSPPGRLRDVDEERQRDLLLDKGVRLTGGARRDVLSSLAFASALTGVARVLAHQFRVVYARPESLIPPETFEVTAAAPGFIAYGGVARGQPR